MPLQLRHYQEKAIQALWDGFSENDGNLLVVLPARTGKALSICEFTRRLTVDYPSVRSLIMTTSMELVSQNYKEMMNLWPEAPAGICCAKLGQKNTTAQIIFGSINSMYKRAIDFQKVDIIHIDEAQFIPRSESAMWLKFFNDVRKINPHVRIAGWTATPWRLDSGRLDEGDDAMFSKVVYEYSVLDAIKEGYLVPPINDVSTTQIDTSKVAVRGGEFVAGQLDAVAADPETVSLIADEMVAKGQDRKSWIFFGCGVQHCMMVRDALIARGISCEGVFAITPKHERISNIERFSQQKIRCLVSVNALAVGFNVKSIDLVGLGRPTQSAGFYIQSAMRGMTLYDGKQDCLLLDWGGNINRHGPLDMPNIKSKSKGAGAGDMPVKACPNCGSDNFIAARECSTCGAPFLIEGSKIDVRASTAPLLTSRIVPTWEPVDGITYARHTNRNDPNKPPTLRVSYLCGLTTYSEYKGFDYPAHTGAKRFADKWWLQRGEAPPPASLDEALKRIGELRRPTEVQVRPKPGTKFFEVMAARFE